MALRCIRGNEDVVIKSLAFESFVYHANRSLAEDETSKILVKVYKPLANSYGASETFSMMQAYVKDTERVIQRLAKEDYRLKNATTFTIDGETFDLY